jgi:hypothetical protein
LPDLCVLTDTGAALYRNRNGVFEKDPAKLPPGRFEKAVWIDYDHDGDLDLLLLGEHSAMVRNNGEAGFSDQTADFPFVAGHAVDGAIFAVQHDTAASDLAVAYRQRAGVLYRDRLNGKYEAIPLETIPTGTMAVLAEDFNNDGFPDLAVLTATGPALIENHQSKFELSSSLRLSTGLSGHAPPGPAVFADLESRGVADLVTVAAVYRNQGQGKFERKAALRLRARPL